MARQSSKESTSNLFNRYVWLVDTIYRVGHITFEDINEKWVASQLNGNGEDIPIRTFHNHRKAIEQMFDINIECDKRNGYTYYIENGEDMERSGVRQWLLNTFAVNNLINESHKLKHRILFEQIPSGQQFLAPIIEAMRDNNKIEITYQSFWSDKPKEIELCPYCVKVFRQRWYLVAYGDIYDDMRIFALDRLQELQISDKTFIYDTEFDAQRYFDDCFGIIMDEDIDATSVEIRVFDKKVKYLRVLPLHHSQEEIETTDNYSVFRYYIKPTYDFRQELLSQGAEVEVLSPKLFREEMKNIVADMKRCYL